VLDYGPGTRRPLPAGTRVCAMPLLRVEGDVAPLGLSVRAPGAFAERFVVEASMMMPVPNGLDPDRAALTEPMAVALHAPRRGDVRKRDVTIVIGCGPVGLCVICMLKAQGVKTIVASDFSPRHRELAQRCGADVVVDPSQDSPFASWRDYGLIGDPAAALRTGVSLLEKARRLPLPLWEVWRLAERAGITEPRRPVIFEGVGAPGVLQQILEGGPALLPRRRRGRLHGARYRRARARDQQGNRPAIRARLHPAGVSRCPLDVGGRQGGRDAAGDWRGGTRRCVPRVRRAR